MSFLETIIIYERIIFFFDLCKNFKNILWDAKSFSFFIFNLFLFIELILIKVAFINQSYKYIENSPETMPSHNVHSIVNSISSANATIH